MDFGIRMKVEKSDDGLLSAHTKSIKQCQAPFTPDGSSPSPGADGSVLDTSFMATEAALVGTANDYTAAGRPS